MTLRTTRRIPLLIFQNHLQKVFIELLLIISVENYPPKEVKKKRDLSSVLDDFPYKLSLSVGTTIHRVFITLMCEL